MYVKTIRTKRVYIPIYRIDNERYFSELNYEYGTKAYQNEYSEQIFRS